MFTSLFLLAILFGFLALPVASLGFVLLPIALISLFNEFAAPRKVLFALFGIAIISSLPPVMRLCQGIWLLVDPGEKNPKHAAMLASQMMSSGWTVAYLSSNGWLIPGQTTWLLITYWFICLTQLWAGFFLVLTVRWPLFGDLTSSSRQCVAGMMRRKR